MIEQKKLVVPEFPRQKEKILNQEAANFAKYLFRNGVLLNPKDETNFAFFFGWNLAKEVSCTPRDILCNMRYTITQDIVKNSLKDAEVLFDHAKLQIMSEEFELSFKFPMTLGDLNLVIENVKASKITYANLNINDDHILQVLAEILLDTFNRNSIYYHVSTTFAASYCTNCKQCSKHKLCKKEQIEELAQRQKNLEFQNAQRIKYMQFSTLIASTVCQDFVFLKTAEFNPARLKSLAERFFFKVGEKTFTFTNIK
ncbi:MAG: hypothetical protein RSB76_01895 [Clostridia bacterium]